MFTFLKDDGTGDVMIISTYNGIGKPNLNFSRDWYVQFLEGHESISFPSDMAKIVGNSRLSSLGWQQV